MPIVVSGDGIDGKPCSFYLDGYLKRTLDIAKARNKKNWDYNAIVCGIPGSGKSTFVRCPIKYCDPNFGIDNIAFNAKQFIKISSECEEYAGIQLDESFQSLNSRVTMSPDFLKIINHLQIIRQKRLFIFLCLPNFFDLSKGVAVFRSSHLFLTYADDDGKRGKFMAFGRDQKRKLYVKGSKYMDYNAEKANYYGRYSIGKNIIDEKEYEKRKRRHLMEQSEEAMTRIDRKEEKIDKMVVNMLNEGLKPKQIGKYLGNSPMTIYKRVERMRPEIRRLLNVSKIPGKL